MTKATFADFLQTMTPELRLRWQGFWRVQGTVRKRVSRRMAELRIDELGAYAALVRDDPEEMARLDSMCRVPVSRFYRDHALFEQIGQVLWERAEQAQLSHRSSIRVWSAGCASGEEAYSVAVAWRLGRPSAYRGLELDVLATDVDDGMLERARRACYQARTLRELPERWRTEAFELDGATYRLRGWFRQGVSFERGDLRRSIAEGPFDMVLCRNLAFTYFDEPLQCSIAERIMDELRPGGVLVVGNHEVLPAGLSRARRRYRSIYEKAEEPT